MRVIIIFVHFDISNIFRLNLKGQKVGFSKKKCSDKLNVNSTDIISLSHAEMFIDAVDGHVVYKWDQITIIKVVFMKLDRDQGGCIPFNRLMQVSGNYALKNLLRFTILGA